MLAKILEKLMSLVVLAAIIWAAWYGYTHWIGASTDSGGATPTTAFNCRQGLARLAEDQACRSSNSCSMTDDEVAQMRQREIDIEQNCN